MSPSKPRTIDELVRPTLLKFKPYSSALSETKEGRYFLHANELSSGSPIALGDPLAQVALNRYPDPDQLALRAKLAERFGLARESVFVGVGSDEVIDLLIRLLCVPGKDSILQLEPTYGVYRVQADLNDVAVISVPLSEDFALDVRRTLAAFQPTTKIAFICSPNNPTGNLLETRKVLELCDGFDGIVVVDQAYVEFTNQSPDPLVAQLSTRPNLVLLRTLSKAWGLAGARLGYCLASPALVSWLLKIKSPYNVNAATSAIALAALAKPDFLEREVDRVANERIRLIQGLRLVPDVTRVYPSDANFVLARFRDRDRVFNALYERGVVVRRRNEAGLTDCLRITVGTREENDLILDTLKRMS